MEFYLQTMEPAIDEAMSVVGEFVGADPKDLAFVDNATVAMNVVAENTPLKPGDEVLINDHEYGAVFRIWRHKCEISSAKLVTARIAETAPISSVDDVVQPIVQSVTARTKLVVVSHITSPSAIVFPVKEICKAARERGIPVCIDGPHAIAMRDVNLTDIGCDYYCASMHKWLSAPCGSGFLFVRRDRQIGIQPHLTSWGKSLSGRAERWQDVLNWLGTRDPAPFLAIPTAFEFLEGVGLANFRRQTHELAKQCRSRLEEFFGTKCLIPDSIDWYGSMTAVPLPESVPKKSKPNAMHPLQQELRDRFRIEVPVMEYFGHLLLRASFHLYNSAEDIDRLMEALAKCHR
jgi:isopenicillin-N epimerase